MTEFRPAKTSERDLILDLYTEVKEDGMRSGYCDWNDYYPNEEILDQDFQENGIFVLTENDKIIAAVSLMKTDDLDQEPLGWKNLKSCVPARLCVSVKHQNKGIAKQVMLELISHSKKEGFQAIRLLASVCNLPANKLYQGLGFTDKGKVSLYNKEFTAYEYEIK
jgi:ribosomal protein S18 acetylase RimI-like enzyme